MADPLVFVVVFGVSALLAWGLSRTAESLGLLAHPGDHRRHTQATPVVGGVAIFAGITVGCGLTGQQLHPILPSLGLLCLVGLLDDRFRLPAWLRFAMQSVAAYLMIHLTGVKLESLGNLISPEPVLLGQWSIPLTIFATIGVINALNMSDGLDGLAGSLVLLVLVSLLFAGSSEWTLIVLSIAAVAGFLVWNLRVFRDRATLFMGDAGSTVLGLIMAYLLMDITQGTDATLAPVSALWILALPLMDAVALLFLRPLRGQSPFSADRIHYHHLIQRMGFGVNLTLIMVIVIQIVFIAVGLHMYYYGIAEFVQFYAFLALFATYFVVLRQSTRRRREA